MKFAIDPGHGMSNATPGVYDPGAVAHVGSTTFQEADIALRYALAVRDGLRSAGHEVFMTRDDATDAAPVGQRAHNAELAGCDLFVSFHLNSSDSAAATGVEVLYRRDASVPLATKLRDAVVEATDIKRRENKKRLDLAVLKFDGIAVLIEFGFISNDNDRSKLLNPATRQRTCESICNVLIEHAKANASLAMDFDLAAESLALSEYQLPSYARKLLGPSADALWAGRSPVSGLNFYSGLVRDSFYKLPSAAGVPNGALLYEAKFAIDGDGSGGNHEGDDAFQPDTSLHDAAGKPLNSRDYPFIVLPLKHNKAGRPQWSDLGVGLGDVGMCVFKNGRKVPVLFGDQGPALKLGEGSMAAAVALGINPDPNVGGIGPDEVPPGVFHIVFPGSRNLVAGAGKLRTQDTPATLKSRAEQLLAALVGSAGAGMALPSGVRPVTMSVTGPSTVSPEAALALGSTISQTGKAKVIIVLRDGVGHADGLDSAGLAAMFVGRDFDQNMALMEAAHAESHGARRTRRSPAPALDPRMRVYRNLGLALGQIDLSGLSALSADPRVVGVVPAPEISLIKPHVAETAKLGKLKTTWGLQAMRVPELWKAGVRGKGIIVGHLDTGVDGSHPALKSALHAFAEFDMAGDQVINAIARDSAWHGTHTAGTIVGRTVKGVSFGVAPEALLASALVIEGGQVIDRILAGLDWIVSKKARVLSLSLGLRGYTPAFEVVIKALRKNGVLPIVAVGNEGPDTSRSPGNYPDVISVGAIDEGRVVASFSSSQRFSGREDPLVPDIVAPGVEILSSSPDGEYRNSDGSSMATPHVAGLAALLMSAAPNAGIDEIERAIINSCIAIAPQARANRGLPDGVIALQHLRPETQQTIVVPTAKKKAPPRKAARRQQRLPSPQPAGVRNGSGSKRAAASPRANGRS